MTYYPPAHPQVVIVLTANDSQGQPVPVNAYFMSYSTATLPPLVETATHEDSAALLAECEATALIEHLQSFGLICDHRPVNAKELVPIWQAGVPLPPALGLGSFTLS